MDVVISQPRYLPALNYLQRLIAADRFIVLDTVQRQGRGWENRNKLLLPDPKWLTIPVASSSREMICNAVIKETEWIKKHQQQIEKYYRNHPFFDKTILNRYYQGIVHLLGRQGSYCEILVQLLLNACSILGIEPKIILASQLENSATNEDIGPGKLCHLCKNVRANRYISGPNGRKYGVESAFSGSGVKVVYHYFEHPKYTQPGLDTFVPYLGFLDAIFSAGKDWTHNVLIQPLVLENA